MLGALGGWGPGMACGGHSGSLSGFGQQRGGWDCFREGHGHRPFMGHRESCPPCSTAVLRLIGLCGMWHVASPDLPRGAR